MGGFSPAPAARQRSCVRMPPWGWPSVLKYTPVVCSPALWLPEMSGAGTPAEMEVREGGGREGGRDGVRE